MSAIDDLHAEARGWSDWPAVIHPRPLYPPQKEVLVYRDDDGEDHYLAFDVDEDSRIDTDNPSALVITLPPTYSEWIMEDRLEFLRMTADRRFKIRAWNARVDDVMKRSRPLTFGVAVFAMVGLGALDGTTWEVLAAGALVGAIHKALGATLRRPEI